MLRQYTWDKVKEQLQPHQRREPEKSDLYRVVNHGRERLPQVWEERFQHQYGALRKEVLETFDAYLNCGLLCHGAARIYCDSCPTSLKLRRISHPSREDRPEPWQRSTNTHSW